MILLFSSNHARFLMIGAFAALSCGEDCTKTHPVRSGEYMIVERWGDREWEWLVGSDVTIDREARLLTIRYTRNETTYEVRYVLER
jgi:hypothetical protein